jgi:calcineurin-like phosphoesterase family protein
MNKILIQNWNNTIKMAADEVYILGDFTMKGGKIASDYLRSLNGKKYLIRGNHDKFYDDSVFDKRLITWVKDYHELTYENYRVVLFHYPILEWNQMHRGAIQLHGHIHSDPSYNLNMIEQGIKRFDVGVDANNFIPVSLEEIVRTLG